MNPLRTFHHSAGNNFVWNINASWNYPYWKLDCFCFVWNFKVASRRTVKVPAYADNLAASF